MKRIIVAVLSVLGCVGCGVREEGGVWPAFGAENATNAYERVAELVKISPRDAGSEGAAYASQWIAQSLRKAGVEPRVDVWRERSGSRESVQFCNVYGEIVGETNSLIVVGSHYDTKSGMGLGFQGANDGGSSTGLALEMARMLVASGVKPYHTIRFAFFDGEECYESYGPGDGLHGSRRMARQLAEGRAEQPVTAVFVLDMVGDEHLQLQLPRNVTPWMASLVLASSVALDRELGGHSGALVRIADSYVIDDHWPFIEQNIPALDLIDFDYGSAPGKHDYWHTEKDTLDKISVDSLGVVGRLAMILLNKMDQRDNPQSARE